MLKSESVDDAVFALEDVRHWELPPSRWLLVSERVDAVAVAVRMSDASELVNATAALALLSPLRGTRIGTEPTVPPPATVAELVNETLDSLRGAAHRQERDDDHAAD